MSADDERFDIREAWSELPEVRDVTDVRAAFASIGQFAVAWCDSYAAKMLTFAREVNARIDS